MSDNQTPAPIPQGQDKCREALRQLEQAATGVFNAGAQTGHQWPKLAVALVNARASLASTPCVCGSGVTSPRTPSNTD